MTALYMTTEEAAAVRERARKNPTKLQFEYKPLEDLDPYVRAARLAEAALRDLQVTVRGTKKNAKVGVKLDRGDVLLYLQTAQANITKALVVLREEQLQNEPESVKHTT